MKKWKIAYWDTLKVSNSCYSGVPEDIVPLSPRESEGERESSSCRESSSHLFLSSWKYPFSESVDLYDLIVGADHNRPNPVIIHALSWCVAFTGNYFFHSRGSIFTRSQNQKMNDLSSIRNTWIFRVWVFYLEFCITLVLYSFRFV